MKNMNIIIILVLLITIIGSISGFCQSEYYYDYDEYVEVEYSDSFVAIEKNDNLSDWSSFFDNNDYLERLDNPFPMPNGMYLMKLKAESDINSSLDQLSENTSVNKIIRSWNSDNSLFLFPTNRFVVFFKDKFVSQVADSIALANDIKEYRKFLGKDNCYLFRVNSGSYNDALALSNEIYESGLANYSKIGFIIPIRSSFTPNDPLYPRQWNLNNTGQGGGTPGADIGMEEAWEYRAAPEFGKGIDLKLNMVILDDGIADHEDLPMYYERIYCDNLIHGPENLPWVNEYHGQAIAGILKGTADNGIGMAGMLRDYDCETDCGVDYVLKCFIIRGPGYFRVYPHNYVIYFADEFSLADAIWDASFLDHAFVISISYDFLYRSLVDTAITQAYNNGTTIFASSGNDCGGTGSGGMDWPARNDKVLGVGASDINDNRSLYSRYGAYVLMDKSE